MRSEDACKQKGVVRAFGHCTRCLCSTEPPLAFFVASGQRCWGCSLGKLRRAQGRGPGSRLRMHADTGVWYPGQHREQGIGGSFPVPF